MERVSRQPSVIPDFSGIASSFSTFSLMLVIGLLYIAFITFRHGSWISDTSNTFNMKWCCIFVRVFQHLMRWSCSFFLWVCLYSGLHWWISVYWTIPASLGFLFVFKTRFHSVAQAGPEATEICLPVSCLLRALGLKVHSTMPDCKVCFDHFVIIRWITPRGLICILFDWSTCLFLH